MSDLMRYAAQLENNPNATLPPLERWNPDYCGEIDIAIKRDGTWFHEGTPIGRAKLARLFSTILKREGGDYFLITPVEKMKITVEDVPFIITALRVEEPGSESQCLYLTTNMGDKVLAGKDHPITVRDYGEDENVPYIMVRAALEARFSRSVYYELVALGQTSEVNGREIFGVRSNGAFFALGAM